MIDFLKSAQAGQPVYISDVRNAYNALESGRDILLVLDMFEEGEYRHFPIKLPENIDKVAEEYLFACIYNIISTLGGRKMTLYFDTQDQTLASLINRVDALFGINDSRKDRKGYARAVNVTDRMLQSLNCPNFVFSFTDISKKPACFKESKNAKHESTYQKVVNSLSGANCGIDIGGTDIKLAVSIDNDIAFFKEYDWFPAAFTRIEELIDPIILLVKLMCCKLTHTLEGGNAAIDALLLEAMKKDASNDAISDAVEAATKHYGESLRKFKGIGLCFPDVVIKNKIVGGEVYKTRGIRNNPDVEYESAFAKLTNLDVLLKPYCLVFNMTNDGPMASYTAAVETAALNGDASVADGVFAHTLGTELGTGWVDETGRIPEIPLEVYNCVIDLGSYVERAYEPDDLRSVNNFNTDIAGTLQKYASQSGVFRLAIKYFKDGRPDLYSEMVEKGFIVEKNGGLYVPTEPVDLRKPFLEYVMGLVSTQNCPVCNRIFEDIGEFLAVTWIETEQMLTPICKSRYLFGRLVKNPDCFDLICKGAKRIVPNIEFFVADGEIANSPLMKQLECNEEYTVAQFAQAVGAIYFAESVARLL